jgi:serine phosphatase RsbU (regulator of sigma subunit)
MPENFRRTTVEQERLRLLFQQAHSASRVAVTGAVVCAAVLLYASPGTGPLLWLAGVVAFTGLRFALYRRFFRTDIQHFPLSYWLRRHAITAGLIGLAWGALPLVPLEGAPPYVQGLPTLVPAFVLMAAITSYGVYLSQYLVLAGSVTVSTVACSLWGRGGEAIPTAILFAVFLPVLTLTAKRYCKSLLTSLEAQHRMQGLVEEANYANAELHHQNSQLARQRDQIEQEEALAKHVFRQLTLGGDHKLPGVHAWNQSMGSLSGDLTQTARGPDGQVYVLLADFTGHGLPAALGALPASSVFLAMAAKGLPVETISTELNRKLRQLLPVGYFCCAVLVELSADRRVADIWNGGLPPVLIRRHGRPGYERIESHSLPLGVVDSSAFEGEARRIPLHDGDLLYAYTDGLPEAENLDGERWGTGRLEDFLQRPDLPTPRLPALIDAVLEHVNLAPASDDISVVEIEAMPDAQEQADAA